MQQSIDVFDGTLKLRQRDQDNTRRTSVSGFIDPKDRPDESSDSEDKDGDCTIMGHWQGKQPEMDSDEDLEPGEIYENEEDEEVTVDEVVEVDVTGGEKAPLNIVEKPTHEATGSDPAGPATAKSSRAPKVREPNVPRALTRRQIRSQLESKNVTSPATSEAEETVISGTCTQYVQPAQRGFI